ncbi:MAG: hypothetical protein ACR2MG_03045 [Pyrinomonadaceae bacterium]
MKLKHLFFCLAVISIFAAVSFSQDDRVANDNAMTNELRKEGVKYETKRAIVWTEKGTLTEQEIKEFAALVNQGIVDIEKYTGIRFDKKHYQAEKIEYFLSSKAGISHGSVEDKPFIYLTPKRVKNKIAHYLHETTHIIAWKSLKSLWLQEGFPSHVETYVAAHYGGYAMTGGVFNPENKPIDELARSLLNTEIGKKVLPLIGLNGSPLTMKPEEGKYIPSFLKTEKSPRPRFIIYPNRLLNFSSKKSV